MKQPEDTRIYPDGGYSWVVVLALFFIIGIGDGLGFTYGLLLVDLLDTFQSNRGQTALVGSLFACFVVAVALLAGPLSDRYGYRVVSVTGALIGATGVFASAFVTELYQLYITFGFVGGTGFGLAVTPAIVCVLHNFNKRRTLANGIGMCGSGAGMLCVGSLVGYILDLYGWRGTFIILAGINLQSVFFALLLNSPGQRKQTSVTEINGVNHCNVNMALQLDEGHNEQTDINGSNELNVVQHMGNDCNGINTSVDEQRITDKTTTGDNIASKTLAQRPTITTVDKVANQAAVHGDIYSFFIEMKTLLTNIRLVSFLFTAVCISFGFLIPIILLPDQAVSNGIPKDKTFWFIAILGIGNTSGKIIFGWLGDIKCMNRFLLFVTTIVLAGICNELSCLQTSFEFKMSYACVYGIMYGGFIALAPAVLTDIMGADNIGKCFGLYHGSLTFGFAFGGPLAGWIYDLTGNYNYPFIMAGAFWLTGAVILCLPTIWTHVRCCGNRSRQLSISTPQPI